MNLEDTSGAQRETGERLFRLIEELTGNAPVLLPSQQAYKAPSDRGVFLYLSFLSARARKYPPLSIYIMAKWDDRLDGNGVAKKNNWFGSNSSADLSIRSDDETDIARGERFIRDAYQLRTAKR